MNGPRYFQRYSQRENVVTNNTLLLFSRLYAYNPYRFAAFIKECLDTSLDIGIVFTQQIPSQHSTPDGFISQTSFKVVIETKLDQSYDWDQLKRHLFTFTNTDEKHQTLLLLGRDSPNNEFVRKVEEEVQAFNKDHKKHIHFVPTTFKAIIDSFESVLLDFDFQIKEIAADFRSFLQEEELLPWDMRAVAVGQTLKENREFNLYYDEQAYRDHTYIGLYAKKHIVSIGKLENIITADYDESRENLKIHDSWKQVTEDQKVRIISVIPKAKENNDWDIAKNHKFFLVNKFQPTKFKTKSTIQRERYFNLREVLGVNQLPIDTAEIAKLLNEKGEE